MRTLAEDLAHEVEMNRGWLADPRTGEEDIAKALGKRLAEMAAFYFTGSRHVPPEPVEN